MNNEKRETGYLDFELKIERGVGREFPVSVVKSPAGEARETMRFPFDELALENRLQALQMALLRSGGKRRRVKLPEEQAVQDFGRALFAALFCGEVRSRFDVSLTEAAQQGRGLRVKLRVQSPGLAALPWEFMFDERQGEFLCLSRKTPIVRYVELPQPIQPLAVELPLRILGLIAAPEDLLELDIQREKQRIETAVKDLEKRGLVKLTWLDGQTWRDLHKAMRQGPWHIFHFIGHGGFDDHRDEGLICLTNEEGKKHLLSATQLGRLLADHDSLRLVLLNACEGARGGGRDIFSSSASILVQRGIPAVIAMQYEITDRAAIEFSRTFYEVLAEGQPIDASTAEARKSISIAVNNTLEWGTPVLYMRSPDGVLFSPRQKTAAKKESPEKPDSETESETELEPAPEPQKLVEEKKSLVEIADSDRITDSKPAPEPEIPADVLNLINKGYQVSKNLQGCWEAEFEDGFVMVYIPAGEFTMGYDKGEDDEKPPHKVYLDAYWIGKYEVNFALYDKYCKKTGKKKPNARGWGKGQRPVINVSWHDAKAFCRWLSKETGLGFKLPTEAQWEKAARGIDERRYPWGDRFNKNKCNSGESGLQRTSPVGSYPGGASHYGCLDMAGNVWEWCSDWYDADYYKNSPDRDPEGPESGSYRVVRGGSWVHDSPVCRASYRLADRPGARGGALGFRLAASL